MLHRLAILVICVLFPENRSWFTENEVCFDGLGCFNNEHPFDNAALVLPDEPSEVGTVFYLFTRHSASPQLLDYTRQETLEQSFFDPSTPTKFIIHGFNNDGKTSWVTEIVIALLNLEPMNVVVVDWGQGAAFPHYVQAVANSRLVARQTRVLLDQMRSLGARMSEVHLIGHSIGAHVAGYIGAALNASIGRISGLDLADPLYGDHDKAVRLDASDAKFVDVIHTNARPFLEGGYGDYEVSGHVDFYVNGGIVQPGCEGLVETVKNLAKGLVSAATKILSCSHSRSHEIFIESIYTKCPFIAFPCKDMDTFICGRCMRCPEEGCIRMGYHLHKPPIRGKFYIDTNKSPPYCGYHHSLKLLPMNDDAKGYINARLYGSDSTSVEKKIFNEDYEYEAGKYAAWVVVVRNDIGHPKSIELTYVKREGIFWGSGADQLEIESLILKSGVTGNEHYYCGDTLVLNSGEPRIIKLSTNSC
ncbi:pancreatic lipase-related protein 2-like [Tubulanus polymorphus]|uniref:pancreatic lipase-related protein 2-like n=1 Tax=Tubulanus polymorphus TaxID=672921 RepID=UPI003DA62A96